MRSFEPREKDLLIRILDLERKAAELRDIYDEEYGNFDMVVVKFQPHCIGCYKEFKRGVTTEGALFCSVRCKADVYERTYKGTDIAQSVEAGVSVDEV